MQNVTKIAVASLAMLLLGSSASMAQPYGSGSSGYGAVHNGPTPGYCGPMTSRITNWIIDPATGQAVTEAQYLARYPGANPATWTYDCYSGLWTDHGPQDNSGYSPQARNYERGRGHGRYRY